jgi:hypothetical protein
METKKLTKLIIKNVVKKEKELGQYATNIIPVEDFIMEAIEITHKVLVKELQQLLSPVYQDFKYSKKVLRNYVIKRDDWIYFKNFKYIMDNIGWQLEKRQIDKLCSKNGE